MLRETSLFKTINGPVVKYCLRGTAKRYRIAPERRGMKLREELEKARQEATKYEMAFKSQQADIDFIRGHVAQLIQSIPSQE